MRRAKDFGGSNKENPYCRFCTNESGDLKSYEKVKEGLTQYIIQIQGIEKDQAEKKAIEGLASMPAWKNR